MRATLYQETSGLAYPRRPAGATAACALVAAAALACHQPSTPAAGPAAQPPATQDAGNAEPPAGRSIHFSLLAPFLPETLAGFTAGPLAASTSRFGGVAVTELERSYQADGRELALRLVDSNINRGASKPKVAEPYEDGQRVGRPLKTASSAGYVEFDKTSGRAHANLIIGERLLLTLDQEEAEGTAALERFCAALDVEGLARLAGQQIARR
jgi:hypothetical protein